MCIMGRNPQYFMDYFGFTSDVCERSTRQRYSLHLPAVRTEVAKKSFYSNDCIVFNS